MALSNSLHTLLRRSEFWSQHLSHLPARRPLKFYGVGTGLIFAVGGTSSCTWRRTETTFVMMLSEFSSSSDSGPSLPARWEQSASLWSSFEKCSGWSVKDTDGNIIQEAPLPVWANLRQRALDTAMTEITKKTDISIEIESLERSKHRRVTTVIFVIKEQAVPDGD
jgi:hypothetical protein